MADSADAPFSPDGLQDCPPELVGKLDDIAKAILAEKGPAVIRFVERRRGAAPIYYFARAEHICEILRNDVDFSLSHYDDLLKAATGDVRFLLGVSDEGRQERVEIVRAVVGGRKTELYEQSKARVRKFARENAERVVSSLLQRGEQNAFQRNLRPEPGGPFLREHRDQVATFNMVREFGFMVPYLTASRFLGIWGPSSPLPLVRVFMTVRNLLSDRPIAFTPETTPSTTMLTWSHLIMGHIFSNFESRNKPLLFLAWWASNEFKASLEKQISGQVPRYDDALLTELRAAQFPNIDPDRYKSHLKCILFEFSGAMIILVGMAFCKILQTLIKEQISLRDFADQIDNDALKPEIDEALRQDSPTLNLFRRVRNTVKVAGVVLSPGDYVCCLVKNACHDQRAFTQPNKISTPDPSLENYLTFGATGGPHACYGQFFAREILREMFVALKALPDLRPMASGTAIREFASLPDDFEFAYSTRRPGAEH